MKTQEMFVERCKARLSLHEPKNPFFAEVENAVMNDEFEKYIGNWYYTKNNIGWFSRVVKKRWALLGYSECHVEYAPLLINSDASRKEQIDFFSDKDFLEIDWASCSELQDYLAELRDIGFWVEFFPWNSTNIQFSCP